MLTISEAAIVSLDHQRRLAREGAGKYVITCPLCEHPEKRVHAALLSNGQYEIFPRCGCDEGRVKHALEKLSRATSDVPVPGANGKEPDIHPLDLKVMDGQELEKAALPTPDALIPHLLYRGFVTLLAGDSKLGKSSLELSAILAGACGGWWLDRERLPENRLPESRILYVNFEDPLFVTRDRALRRMAPEPLPKNFLTMPPPYGTTLPGFLDWLYGAHEKLSLDAVVIDPIAIAAEWADETDNAETARTLKPLGRLAAETMLGILLAHHVTKKPGQYGLNIRGASAIKANVLGYLVLERDKELFKLSGINKLSGMWDVTLDRTERDWSWWITDTHSGSMRSTHQVIKSEMKAEMVALVIAQALLTTKQLAEFVGLNERTCRRYLMELKEEGVLLSQEIPPGKLGGRPETGWVQSTLGIE